MNTSDKTYIKESDYFDALDGFRGFAVLLILCFHSMFPIFSPLWLGVPMFFVLSGFLITRILIQQKQSHNFLKTFYLKRSLRIFPIYYLALFVSEAWGTLVHADLSKLPIFIVYFQNFTISSNLLPDYCNGIMNHTWSLSAEEIFYLAWPLLILVTPTKKIKALCISLGVSSLLFKFILLAFFYNELTSQLLQLSLIGNLDGLMAGALLGVLSLSAGFPDKKISIKILVSFTLFFLLSLIANYIDFKNARIFAVSKTFLSVFTVTFSFLIIGFASKDLNSPLHKFFRTSFMQFTGKISYGIYLYHALVYGITASCMYHYRIAMNPVLVFFFEVLVTYVVAILSWYVIEKPVLGLKNKLRYSKK